VRAAITYLRQALDLFRVLGDAIATAEFLTNLGHAYRQAGDRAATTAWTEAAALRSHPPPRSNERRDADRDDLWCLFRHRSSRSLISAGG
jgi:hypothetical protein